MKLKEQFSGNGDVFDTNEKLGKVNYQLYIYQETHNANGEEIEGLKNVIGKIDSKNAMMLFDKDNLILTLEDGRCIHFFVSNLKGDIECSGDFFKEES